MRPRVLKFAGLRSYRRSTEIAFDDLDLFAIIGDTGAGKSTIIEALCLALYGRKTWSGGSNLTDLIADGEDVWRVEFTFDAEGHTWKVTRARRRSKASPVDKLESTTNHVPMVDGSREVTKRIEELLGLECEQFTRAVVMPQGRFDELLRSTESDRNEILKSILGLGDIDQIRQEVVALRDQVKDIHIRYTERRRNLPADPAKLLVGAQVALESATARQELLSSAIEAIREPRNTKDLIAGTLDPLKSALASVPSLDSDPPTTLRACLQRSVELHKELEGAIAQLQEAEQQIAGFDQQTAAALQGLQSRDAAVLLASRLADAVEEFPTDIDKLEKAEHQLAELRSQAPSTTLPPQYAEALVQAETALSAARDRHDQARHAAEEAQSLIQQLNDARALAAESATAVKDAAANADEASESLATAIAALQEARTSERAARKALDQVRHHNMVATLTEGRQPGDDCPVCDQPLPDDFAAPQSTDLQTATDAAVQAEQAVEAAQRHATDATQARGHAVASVDAATRQLEAAVGKVADLETKAKTAGVDTHAQDVPEAIRALEEAGAAASKDLEAATAAETAARKALTDAESDLRVTTTRHDAAVATAEQAVDDAARRIERHRTLAAGLPSTWQTDGPVTADTLVSTHRRCVERISTIDRVATQRAEADTRKHAAATAESHAKANLSEDVIGPARLAIAAVNSRLGRVQEVAAAAEACADAAHLESAVNRAGLDAIPAEVTTDNLGSVSKAVDTRLAAANAILISASDVATAASQAAEACQSAIIDALTSADCKSIDELHSRHGQAATEAKQADTELARATANVAAARHVDEVLAVVAPFHDNLVVLAAALANNQFVDHLLELREAELLAEASRRLKSISNNRFGFVADFGVKSIASGEVRTPDSLSGGERFQASLALALALVEIASRGGGRLDAVFIDEGFGSLDANALDTALATLGKVAGGGKMVALISHLRSVAEYVDTVLHVTRDDVIGSRIHTLSEDDRDRLLASDIRSGLNA